MQMDPIIFREYDIRGIYMEQFDLKFAEQLGRAYASYLANQLGRKTDLCITIGHDARLSSPDIVEALRSGLNQSGVQVKLLGLVTSPISYYTTFALSEIQGSIMVTGSHNPPNYNGFKISVGKSTIFGAEIQELKKIIDNQNFIQGNAGFEELDIIPHYVNRYREEFGQFSPIKLVLDCGNGAAGAVARRLYEALGLKPTILFEEPDGTFPNHHPDPTVEENLLELSKTVVAEGARVGIGFDGDADRIGVVDDEGRFVYGDELIALCARQILAESPGEKIIGDVKCSDRMYDYIDKYGGKPIMWKTGHSLIKEKIKLDKAPFGGEMSGHVFFSDRNYGYDDALYAGLRIVEILSKTGKTIRELLSDLPPAYNTPELRIDTTEDKKHAIVAKLKEVFSQEDSDYKVNLMDGIRVSFPSGWALARASNTQPVLVLRFEADSQENLNLIRGKFEDIVKPML